MAGDDHTGENKSFVQYHEPNIVQILILVSFFLFLSLGEWLSNKIFRAGLIGQIVVGLIYGLPIGNLLELEWQQTFIALGYLGLILIIFEGALAVRLDLLKKNFLLSLWAATIGVIAPIGLSYLVLYLGFGYQVVETFIIGSALSVTSLGTTFVVIGKASTEINFSDTKVGTVLLSAAVIDDVTGLVMASVIDNLGELGKPGVSLGWVIGRPNLASGLLAIFTPIITKWLIAPIFRHYIEDYFPRHKHTANILLMPLVLSGFLAISAYAGTSVLFGSFLAGAFLSYIPSKHLEGPFVVPSREEAEKLEDKTPTFLHTFEKYLLDVQQYLMEPLFFASIGFAIPFSSLWSGKAIWRGIVYTIVMWCGKIAVGTALPVWDIITRRKEASIKELLQESLWPSLLLGSAMVARGEIGLLIIQIGLNKTDYLSTEAFITAVWAIVLNTIIGPTAVGFLVKYKTHAIAEGYWGIQEPPSIPPTPSRGRSRSMFSVRSIRTERTEDKTEVDSSYNDGEVDLEAGKPVVTAPGADSESPARSNGNGRNSVNLQHPRNGGTDGGGGGDVDEITRG